MYPVTLTTPVPQDQDQRTQDQDEDQDFSITVCISEQHIENVLDRFVSNFFILYRHITGGINPSECKLRAVQHTHLLAAGPTL